MSRSPAHNLCKYDLHRSLYIQFASLQKLILHFMLGIDNFGTELNHFAVNSVTTVLFFSSDFGSPEKNCVTCGSWRTMRLGEEVTRYYLWAVSFSVKLFCCHGNRCLLFQPRKFCSQYFWWKSSPFFKTIFLNPNNRSMYKTEAELKVYTSDY